MKTLSRRVLVLNRSWMAINVISVKDAITLLFAEYEDGKSKARIIDPSNDFSTFTWDDWAKIRPKDGEDTIRGVGRDFRIPEVILLTRYDKFTKRQVKFSRHSIYKRDGFTCQYCGKRPGSEELTIDHVMPRSLGGKTTWENCVLSCIKCNNKKDNKTLKEAHMKLAKKPSIPKFNLLELDYKLIPKSWKNFISTVYWETELENDN